MSSSTLARIVFGALVLATVGAFFLTQRLKHSPPPVRHIVVSQYVTPRGGPYRVATVGFTLPRPDYVTVSIVNAGGDEVLRLLDDRPLERGLHTFEWGGHGVGGSIPADGDYFARIVLHGQGRQVTSPTPIDLVTRPPRVRLAGVRPSRLAAGQPATVTIRFTGPANRPPRVTVYRTDQGPPRAVASFDAPAGAHVARWNVRLAGGADAPPGVYAFAVTAMGAAQVPGSAPPRLPPAPDEAVRGSGLTISGPAAAGPLVPLAPGQLAHVNLTQASGAVHYRLAAVGVRRPLAAGTATAPQLAIPVPRRAATGVYQLELRGSGGSASYPLALRRPAASPPKVLLVLPALNWAAENPLDSRDDGFPDTLEDGTAVSLLAPFAFGRVPADFESQASPLARFLATQHLSYDVTTDIALTRGEGAALAGHRGVVLAGGEHFATAAFDDALRAYVRGGGRVFMLDADSLRQPAVLAGNEVERAGGPSPADAFGERTAPASSEAAPLVVTADQLGLFDRTSGDVGLFTHFEQSQGLPPGAHTLTAAGRDPSHPAFIAYRLGRGLVVRAGTSQWASALPNDPQVGAVTASLWSLLAG